NRRRHHARITNELADDLRARLRHVELDQAACVQIQRHRRSSSTIDAAALPVIFTGRLAPVGLPPFQCARPSETSWCAQSTSAGISTGLIVAIERPRSVTSNRAPDRTRFK